MPEPSGDRTASSGRPRPAPTSELVGRRLELRIVDGALDAVESGSAPVLAIAGEPGIGKTRLLAEVSARAGALGYLVLAGRGTELEQNLPFGVVVDALNDHLTSLRPDGLGSPKPPVAPELACLLTSLTSRPDRPARRLQQERYETYRSVRALLDDLAAERPLVLALDDLHWADPASVELVSHLMRHPPHGRVLLVAAFRSTQVAPELESVLHAACRRGDANRLDLAPLTLDEAAELIGAGMDRAVCEALWLESGGNPFYLDELLRAGCCLSHGDRGVPALGDIPPAVRRALAEELGALSPAARTLLESGAVAGDAFDLDLAGALCDMGEREVLGALDELLGFDLLRCTPLPRRFRFRHPIVRRAAYESTPAGRRISAHARTAVLLAEWGAPASARAHHIERSASRGDEQAVTALAQAAREAAEEAPATAAHWYRAALRLLPGGADHAERRLELLGPLAGALCAVGHLEEGREVLLGALDLVGPGAEELRIRLVASCAGIEHLLGHHAEAQTRLAAALRHVPGTSPARPVLAKELGVGAMYANEFAQARDWAAQAHAAARRDGDQLILATSGAMAAYAEAWLGCSSAAAPYLGEAQALVDGLSDTEAAPGLEALFWLGFGAHFMDRLDDAIRHFERGIRICRATSQGRLLMPMMMGLELSLTNRGRLAGAAELAEATLEGARLSGNNLYLVGALWERCLLATTTGDIEAALTAGQEGLDLAHRMGERTLHAAASWALAGALFEAGHLERSRTLLLDGLGGPDLPRMGAGGRCRSYELLTATELGRGRLEAASGWSRRAELVASSTGLPLAGSAALRASGAVLLASGEAAAAAERALAAAELSSSAGAAVEAARSRLLAGRALAEAGDRLRGLAELEQAQAELAACGAEGWRQQAARELRRLGRRVPLREQRVCRGGDHGALNGLSPRELDVARLVAAGQTNRQVADALYLSIKTVERHLAHIFTKLGVGSRAEVAALVGAHEAKGGHDHGHGPDPAVQQKEPSRDRLPWLHANGPAPVLVRSAAPVPSLHHTPLGRH